MRSNKPVYTHGQVAMFMLQGASYAAILLLAVGGFLLGLDFIGSLLPDAARVAVNG